MPAKSEKQRKLFAAALGFARKDPDKAPPSIRKILETMTEAQMEDFARKRK
jgi:hypothetical protein